MGKISDTLTSKITVVLILGTRLALMADESTNSNLHPMTPEARRLIGVTNATPMVACPNQSGPLVERDSFFVSYVYEAPNTNMTLSEFIQQPHYQIRARVFQTDSRQASGEATCSAYNKFHDEIERTLATEPAAVKEVHAIYRQIDDPRAQSPTDKAIAEGYRSRLQDTGFRTTLGYQANVAHLTYLKDLLTAHDDPAVIEANRARWQCMLAEIKKKAPGSYNFALQLNVFAEDYEKADIKRSITNLTAKFDKVKGGGPAAPNTIPQAMPGGANARTVVPTPAAYILATASTKATTQAYIPPTFDAGTPKSSIFMPAGSTTKAPAPSILAHVKASTTKFSAPPTNSLVSRARQ